MRDKDRGAVREDRESGEKDVFFADLQIIEEFFYFVFQAGRR